MIQTVENNNNTFASPWAFQQGIHSLRQIDLLEGLAASRV